MVDNITIEINNLRCFARHGVMPQEHIIGNEFEVTVHLCYPSEKALLHDCLEDTINYAEVCHEIKQVMTEPSLLLEHVCGRIRNALLHRFPLIKGGLIRVAKLTPPIPNTQLQSVAVSLKW